MRSFDFYAPTRILFGKNRLPEWADQVAKVAKRVLLAYGGGSIRKNGIYDALMQCMKERGIQVYELAGIEPNPRVDSVRKGVELCRKHDIQALLAVGGGSTIDCCKAISASVNSDCDPWDVVVDISRAGKAIPIFTILTLSATGSEMNGNAVISNPVTKEKRALASEAVKPVCSLLDPTYTYTVSKFQTACGVADTMSHILEVYFSDENDAAVSDGISESLLRVCIRYAMQAIEHPDDYNARANLMWASTLGLNGLTSCGTGNEWSCHPIEHQLSAHYDITHGAGLAIVTPAWMRYILSEATQARFAQYARNVWGVGDDLSEHDAAVQGIGRTQEFFRSIGLPTTLREVGIDSEDAFAEMAYKAVRDGNLGFAYVPLKETDVVQIYRNCK